MADTQQTQERFAQFYQLNEAVKATALSEFRAENDYRYGKTDEIELLAARQKALEADTALQTFLKGGK
jgi:hypothetical protein